MCRKDTFDADTGTYINEPCPFCGYRKVWLENEHYHSCSECKAEYTYLMVVESNCEHIKDGVPTLFKARATEFDFKKSTFIDASNPDSDEMWCSECGKDCLADGW